MFIEVTWYNSLSSVVDSSKLANQMQLANIRVSIVQHVEKPGESMIVLQNIRPATFACEIRPGLRLCVFLPLGMLITAIIPYNVV